MMLPQNRTKNAVGVQFSVEGCEAVSTPADMKCDEQGGDSEDK